MSVIFFWPSESSQPLRPVNVTARSWRILASLVLLFVTAALDTIALAGSSMTSNAQSLFTLPLSLISARRRRNVFEPTKFPSVELVVVPVGNRER